MSEARIEAVATARIQRTANMEGYVGGGPVDGGMPGARNLLSELASGFESRSELTETGGQMAFKEPAPMTKGIPVKP
jgi:hypothetical protein